jgi:hypothetical protein
MRIDVLGQVEAHSVWRLRPLSLREVSETGFSVESTDPFEFDVVHKFRLGIDGQSRSIVVQARVQHCALVAMVSDLPTYLTGFALVDPGDNVVREMKAFVNYADALWCEDL